MMGRMHEITSKRGTAQLKGKQNWTPSRDALVMPLVLFLSVWSWSLEKDGPALTSGLVLVWLLGFSGTLAASVVSHQW